ncbi:MAG: hypothetical protein WCK59_03795 [Candidatus Falkowbacteria bacterium]
MEIIKSSENLEFVFEKLKSLKFTGGKFLSPTKDNALYLLLLYDLKDIVIPAKEGLTFNEKRLIEILEADFIHKVRVGKAAQYLNFKETLAEPEYLEQFRATMS